MGFSSRWGTANLLCPQYQRYFLSSSYIQQPNLAMDLLSGPFHHTWFLKYNEKLVAPKLHPTTLVDKIPSELLQ